MRKGWGIVVLAGAMLAMSGGTAIAQILGLEPPEVTVPERQSVLNRPRPAYDPVGGRIGDFFLFPSGEMEKNWNSNIFATSSNAKSDFYTSARPAFSVLSDWGTNQLNFLANAEIRRYATNVSENQTNYSVLINGRLDVTDGSHLTSGIGFQNAHEDRTEPSTLTTQVRPTEYQEASGKLKYVYERGLLGLSVDGNVDYYSYDNTITGGGTLVRESDRNRVEAYGGPRVSYEIVPGYHAFIRTAVNTRIYQSTFDSTGIKRSSHGFEGDVGTAFELSRLINGEVFVGYLQQNYDDAQLSAIHGVGFGGNLLWNMTQATSFRANVSRTVQEVDLFQMPATSTATAYLQTLAGAAIEHELLPNVVLTGGASFAVQSYQSITRTDNIVEGDLGVRYLLNRNWSIGLATSYQSRTSNISGVNYNQAQIDAKLRLQL
jgi:hypothetical protein